MAYIRDRVRSPIEKKKLKIQIKERVSGSARCRTSPLKSSPCSSSPRPTVLGVTTNIVLSNISSPLYGNRSVALVALETFILCAESVVDVPEFTAPLWLLSFIFIRSISRRAASPRKTGKRENGSPMVKAFAGTLRTQNPRRLRATVWPDSVLMDPPNSTFFSILHRQLEL